MERLTPDLTVDIFSRLPIRSLLRARCVCKSWYTLTSDPMLSNILYLKRSSINNDDNDAIVATFPNNYSRYNYKELYFSEQPSLSEENISLFTKKIDLSFINGIETLRLYVVGTCYGLLCLATMPTRSTPFIPKSIHILNPITGEHQQLPDFASITCVDEVQTYTYGFGFDDCKNVFKVVLFLSHVNDMQVWTIGLVNSDNRWKRKLGNIPNVWSYQDYFSAFVGGFLHLIGSNRGDPDVGTIVVSFHLGCEEIQVIQTPDSIALKNYVVLAGYFTLGVIDNCLSFVDAANDGFVEIWLRKNENGFFSWIKTFSIHYGELIARQLYDHPVVFLTYRKDGELLLLFYNSLLSYNAKSNTSIIFEIFSDQAEKFYSSIQTYPFVGSLISIKSHA